MEILNGTLEKVKDSDFSLGDRLYSGISVRRHNGPRAVYNQLNISPYACFYAASFAAAGDCYPLTAEDRRKARLIAEEGWSKLVADGKFVPNVGGYLVDGVDYARRTWNSAFPDKQVVSYRMDNGSNDFLRCLILGYAPVIGYYASKEKTADVLDNGTIEGDTKDASTYGHLVRIESGFRVIDNYPTRGRLAEAGRNKYYMDDYDVKLRNGLLMKSSYIFLPK